MIGYDFLELNMGDYVPGSGTVNGFEHGAPLFDGILKTELEIQNAETAQVLGWWKGSPIYDPKAPELLGGYSDD